MQDSHSCDPGSIPGRRNLIVFENFVFSLKKKYFSFQLLHVAKVVLSHPVAKAFLQKAAEETAKYLTNLFRFFLEKYKGKWFLKIGSFGRRW